MSSTHLKKTDDENPTARFAGKAFTGATGVAGAGVPAGGARRVLADVSNKLSTRTTNPSTSTTAAACSRSSSVAPGHAPALSSTAGASSATLSSAAPSTSAAAAAPAESSRSRSRTLSEAERGIAEVVAADRSRPERVGDYVNSIMRSHFAEEGRKTPSSNFMAMQTDLNEKMRAILIDWLVEVHLKFKLMPETLYLSINIIDRFLERKMVPRQKLQLVGVTASLLAAKYEEIYAPEVHDFVYVTDNAYSREDILRMEQSILNALKFQLTVPTVYVFMQRFLKVANADSRLTHLTNYYVERTLQEYRMLKHLPSKIAASAVNLALRSLGRTTWSPALQQFSTYDEASLQPCVMDLHTILTSAVTSSLQAVRKKYAVARYHEVSRLPIPHLA